MSNSGPTSAAQLPGLRCLRCGSAQIVVLRELRTAGNSPTVDTRCVDCREQSVRRRE